MLLYTA